MGAAAVPESVLVVSALDLFDIDQRSISLPNSSFVRDVSPNKD
jgi:hypothetical protein